MDNSVGYVPSFQNYPAKKAQIWGLDVMVAIVIFLIGIITIYLYALNFMNESQNTLDSLFYEGNLASSLILSDGVPENWTSENVDIPGILTKNKINQTKLNSFYSLAENPIDYEKLKKMLSIKEEFYFNFSGMEIYGSPRSYVGKLASNPENLVRTERFSIYKEKPIKIEIYSWN